jgi:alpha-D-ribose 1-methylphosphonate 5-triphosphate synthase subunit PhnL
VIDYKNIYNGGVEWKVLKEVSFEIAKGECVAIMDRLVLASQR